MSMDLLRPLYRDVYGDEFDKTKFSNRMEMQKMVYLLSEEGIRVGDYSFSWYKHGPYSQALQDDILAIDENEESPKQLQYSTQAKQVVENLSQLFSTKTAYDRARWVECLASMEYIHKNITHEDATKDDVINELKNRKKHLSNDVANALAWEKLCAEIK